MWDRHYQAWSPRSRRVLEPFLKAMYRKDGTVFNQHSVRKLRDIALGRNVASVVLLHIDVDSCSICQNVPMRVK